MKEKAKLAIHTVQTLKNAVYEGPPMKSSNYFDTLSANVDFAIKTK